MNEDVREEFVEGFRVGEGSRVGEGLRVGVVVNSMFGEGLISSQLRFRVRELMMWLEATALRQYPSICNSRIERLLFCASVYLCTCNNILCYLLYVLYH